MILFRCFPWDSTVRAGARGGALWFPRMLQGDGRHDAPNLYGCLYVSEEPVSPVVEQLACLRGNELDAGDLVRVGRPLSLAALALDDEAELVDLDEPRILEREGLRPSRVATHERSVTQAIAAGLYRRHEQAAGFRWWSTFESLWANVTLYDRARSLLRLEDIHPLELGDDVVGEAAAFLGLALGA